MRPPIRFVTGTGAAWIGVRAASLLLPIPWAAVGPNLLPQSPHASLVTSAAAKAAPETAFLTPSSLTMPPVQAGSPVFGPVTFATLAALAHAAVPQERRDGVAGPVAAGGASAAPEGAQIGGENVGAAGPPVSAGEIAALPSPAAPASSGHGGLTGSAWLLVRGGMGGVSAAPAGELGGSQAGVRLAWRPDGAVPLALAARVSGPTGGEPGAEAALGLAWQPQAGVPVTLTAERRTRLDSGGRDAWAAYAAGGVYDRRLPGGFRLDGYGEAGVVGAHRRDLFADGAVRVGQPVPVGHATVTAGAGLWGAAQPHLARLDAGPQAAVRVPAGHAGIVAAVDWRFRLAGNARPRSGPALTLGVDF